MPKRTAFYRALALIAALAAATILAACNGGDEGKILLVNNADLTSEGLPDGTNRTYASGEVHYLVIRDDPDDPNKVYITNRDGSDDDIKVLHGDLVLWSNRSAMPRKIEFDDEDQSLFGVRRFTVHSKDWVTLRVRQGAKTDFKYIYTSDHRDDAPPGIIVCPPPGC